MLFVAVFSFIIMPFNVSYRLGVLNSAVNSTFLFSYILITFFSRSVLCDLCAVCHIMSIAFIFCTPTFALSGPGSVVGIATAYGLDGPGIESRWGRDFPHLSRPGLRPTQPPV